MRPDLIELAANDESLCEPRAIAFEALRRMDEAEDAGRPMGHGESFYPNVHTGQEALEVFREQVEQRLGFRGLTSRKAHWLLSDAEKAASRERMQGSAFWHLSPQDGLHLGVCVVCHPDADNPDEWCETAFEIEPDATAGDRWAGPEVFIRVTRECRVDGAAMDEREAVA
jgi:hypothetical protein